MKRTLQMLVMLVSLWACAVCGSGVHIVAPINEHGPQSHLQLQKRKVRDTESMATEITSLNVMSYIASRFANTMVNSKIVNKEMTAREIEFNVQLPDSAFIANFSMELNGTTYVGEVKEKQKAAEAYKKAKKRGHSAGQVSVKPRSTNTFKVSVNVAAGSRLSFTLTYQEMLQRRLGVYEHRISIRPGQIVNRLKIDVYITEPQGLEFIYAPPIVTNVLDSWNIDQSADSPATIDRLSDTRAHVYYYPTRDEQKNQSSEGISGDFVIRYDVSHDLSAGQIQVLNGYFVHYFAPTGLPPVQKNVLFVIDVSGSMDGAKMGQTKEALRVILDDMRSFDRFNILTFSYEVSFWKENMMILATQENILEAKNFVNNLRASGGTNFNGGLVEGVEMLRRVTDDAENTERSAFLVIMLTDGQPTSGETQLTKIQENAKTYIDGQYSLFCLGFGGDVNFKFLQKISLENQGIARRIYEDADGYLQLKGFYDEVATPLLFDVDIQYLGDNVEENSMTQSTFPNYFNGSELVVAGRLVDNDVLQTRITANTADTQLELDAEIDPTVMPSVLVNKHIPEDFIERLWAYLTIKELLKKRVLTVDPEENASLSAKALDLSLKYNFVTPLTSMVVIKPEEPTTNAARGEAEESEDNTANSGRVKPKPVRPAAVKKSRKISRTSNRQRGYAYGDPHFVVELQDSDETVCFNINGDKDDVLNLVSDPIAGVYANSRLIEEGKTSTNWARRGTYLGEVGVVLHKGKSPLFIRVTVKNISINHTHMLPWKPMKMVMGNITLRVSKSRTFSVSQGEGITLVIHLVRKHPPTIGDYFGFYIEDGRGFSEMVHGLIGQFHSGKISIENMRTDIFDPIYQQADLRVGDRNVTVYENYRKDPKNNLRIRCWFAHNNARGVIDGKHKDYFVQSIFSRDFSAP